MYLSALLYIFVYKALLIICLHCSSSVNIVYGNAYNMPFFLLFPPLRLSSIWPISYKLIMVRQHTKNWQAALSSEQNRNTRIYLPRNNDTTSRNTNMISRNTKISIQPISYRLIMVRKNINNQQAALSSEQNRNTETNLPRNVLVHRLIKTLKKQWKTKLVR